MAKTRGRARRSLRGAGGPADDERLAPLARDRRGGRRDLRPVRERGPHELAFPVLGEDVLVSRAGHIGLMTTAVSATPGPPRRRLRERTRSAARSRRGWGRRSRSTRASGTSATSRRSLASPHSTAPLHHQPRDGETFALEVDHWRYAEIENPIRELRYGVGQHHLRSGKFAANGGWPACQVMAQPRALDDCFGLQAWITTTNILLRRAPTSRAVRLVRCARRLSRPMPTH